MKNANVFSSFVRPGKENRTYAQFPLSLNNDGCYERKKKNERKMRLFVGGEASLGIQKEKQVT